MTRRNAARTGVRWHGALLAVVLLGVLATTAACTEAGSPPARGDRPDRSVVISAGVTTGVYYAWSRQLARQLATGTPRLQLLVRDSAGSVENLDRLRSGSVDLALSTLDATEPVPRTDLTPNALDAATAEQVAANARVLRALGRIYDDYVQVVVRADSELHSIGELAGRPVAVNTPGSGTALVARRLLDAAGITVRERDLGVTQGMLALERREVAAVVWSGGIPTPSITATARRVPLRLLPLDDLAPRLRTAYGAVYRPATIPPAMYPGTDEVATLASANLLVVRADADPVMVTTVLSTIFARRDMIGLAVPAANGTDRRTAIWTGRLALHPAAVEFYRRSKP